jgi:hypothetical protein
MQSMVDVLEKQASNKNPHGAAFVIKQCTF